MPYDDEAATTRTFAPISAAFSRSPLNLLFCIPVFSELGNSKAGEMTKTVIAIEYRI